MLGLAMDALATMGRWISENESLLSGMAAMIVLAGVLWFPLGAAYRKLKQSNSSGRNGLAVDTPGESSPERITLKDLTAPSSHEIQFAQSDGVRIAFSDRGKGPPNLILAAGIINHLNIMEHLPPWRDTLRALSQFARVLNFDKRGQGLSDPTLNAPSLEDRTRDIEAVMDAADLERAILVGVSEGGSTCIHFAHTHPERVQGLVLIGTTAKFMQCEDYPIGIPRQLLENLGNLWGTGKLRDIFFPSISREQIDDKTYKAMEQLIGSRGAVRQVLEMMINADVRSLLSEITVPTLVIHFSGDLAIPIRLGRYIAENIPNAEFMEVPGVDHVDLSQSAEAVARVRSFCEAI